ncbi:MAG: hypothetical protein PHX04_03645 [Bacilli bacterium]|nr:hypothetical protein [Bacilli bacterium]
MKIKFKKSVFILAICTIFGVINVNAEEMSSVFKDVFPEGKMKIKSVAPKDEEQAWSILAEDNIGRYEGFYLLLDTCNEAFTMCEVCYNCGPGLEPDKDSENHEINFEYTYDSKLKEVVDSYFNKIPEGKNLFAVKDLEIINYWVNEGTNMINYSGELKSYIDNKNFNIDLRCGGGTEFTDSGIGIAKAIYDKTIYYINSSMGFTLQQAIYVPDDTELDKDKLMAVAQARIDNYVGPKKVTLKYGGLVEEWLESTDEEYGYHESYNDEDGELHFLQAAAGGHYYKAVVGEREYFIAIIRSTKDMVNPKYISSDVVSDITISSDNGIIPLDTLISADRLTKGIEFEKISKILNLASSEIFDLKLYSNTLEDYITKLDNGLFEVKIPISEKFKDKKLIAYYIDDNGNKTEYDVKVENGMAIFNTNHFSIYTLAENTLDNPQTIDNISAYIILGTISIIGLIGCTIYLRKKQTN